MVPKIETFEKELELLDANGDGKDSDFVDITKSMEKVMIKSKEEIKKKRAD